MKNKALFSSKDKRKKLKCRLLQFLFGTLRVNNTFLTSGLDHLYYLAESISSFRVFFDGFFSFLLYFAKKFLYTKSFDPDQMPHSIASELDLHWICMSIPTTFFFVFFFFSLKRVEYYTDH